MLPLPRVGGALSGALHAIYHSPLALTPLRGVDYYLACLLSF
jgi:hypothetical protein